MSNKKIPMTPDEFTEKVLQGPNLHPRLIQAYTDLYTQHQAVVEALEKLQSTLIYIRDYDHKGSPPYIIGRIRKIADEGLDEAKAALAQEGEE